MVSLTKHASEVVLRSEQDGHCWVGMKRSVRRNGGKQQTFTRRQEASLRSELDSKQPRKGVWYRGGGSAILF